MSGPSPRSRPTSMACAPSRPAGRHATGPSAPPRAPSARGRGRGARSGLRRVRALSQALNARTFCDLDDPERALASAAALEAAAREAGDVEREMQAHDYRLVALLRRGDSVAAEAEMAASARAGREAGSARSNLVFARGASIDGHAARQPPAGGGAGERGAPRGPARPGP